MPVIAYLISLLKTKKIYKEIIEANNIKYFEFGSLLDFTYFSDSCKPIIIDLRKYKHLKAIKDLHSKFL